MYRQQEHYGKGDLEKVRHKLHVMFLSCLFPSMHEYAWVCLFQEWAGRFALVFFFFLSREKSFNALLLVTFSKSTDSTLRTDRKKMLLHPLQRKESFSDVIGHQTIWFQFALGLLPQYERKNVTLHFRYVRLSTLDHLKKKGKLEALETHTPKTSPSEIKFGTKSKNVLLLDTQRNVHVASSAIRESSRGQARAWLVY